MGLHLGASEAEAWAAALSDALHAPLDATSTLGALGGIAMGTSAWIQGRIGAVAADAMAETGKGFGNYLMALGIIETVALFAMVFLGQIL